VRFQAAALNVLLQIERDSGNKFKPRFHLEMILPTFSSQLDDGCSRIFLILA